MTDTAQVDELKQLLAEKTGLRVPSEAQARYTGMLRERAARRKFAALEEYRDFLMRDEAAAELEEFARIFTSGETFFFRDHGQFDLLRLRLLPELMARHRRDKTLRLWSAGCASGEEAYSLAMLVDMLLPERGDWDILILGTDIDSNAIGRARLGRYGQWSFRAVPDALRQRYFRREGGEWLLNGRIRRMAVFRPVNLTGGRFPDYSSALHDMDLILCRNVFIYLDAAAVSAIAAKFAATLAEGGYLMTGHTELIGHPVAGLESRLFAEGVVHQRPVQPLAYAAPPAVTAAAARIVPVSPAPVIPIPAPNKKAPAQPQIQNPAAALAASAREHADRGEYEPAARLCHEALAADPLAVEPYFLLAQLAQLKDDAEQAKSCLNKAIYLDRHCVAAYLELAALHERGGDMPRALALRRAALGIVRAMPDGERIEQYESTAGELAKWLEQWDPANSPGGEAGHERSPRHGE